MRLKLVLIILLALAGGCLVGVIEAELGHRIWPLLAGLGVVGAAIVHLAHRTISTPVEDLIGTVRRSRRMQRPPRANRLPLDRRDEVGDLAQLVHELSVQAYRELAEVNQLRRTIDHRVEKSTRAATQQLQQMAMRDPLTELGNRRFLDANLESLIKTCREAHTDVTCLLIDMDNFKLVNDRLGHAIGDQLLTFVAQLIRAHVRREDYAIRLGGDEFLVLMPGAGPDQVHHFVEQLPALFAQQMRTVLPRDMSVSLSIGIASLGRDMAKNGAHLMEIADENLYAAKGAGKGCAVGLR
ncbi:MAG: diguanylate cyclase [Planctomycetes bacterium]|nr:diguanylate cyclase [Planctomycetota bacterium]